MRERNAKPPRTPTKDTDLRRRHRRPDRRPPGSRRKGVTIPQLQRASRGRTAAARRTTPPIRWPDHAPRSTPGRGRAARSGTRLRARPQEGGACAGTGLRARPRVGVPDQASGRAPAHGRGRLIPHREDLAGARRVPCTHSARGVASPVWATGVTGTSRSSAATHATTRTRRAHPTPRRDHDILRAGKVKRLQPAIGRALARARTSRDALRSARVARRFLNGTAPEGGGVSGRRHGDRDVHQAVTPARRALPAPGVLDGAARVVRPSVDHLTVSIPRLA